MKFSQFKILVLAMFLTAISTASFATIVHFSQTPVESKGQILASSFFDESFYMVGRVSASDATKTKRTLNDNAFGSEYEPQVGDKTEVSEEAIYSWEISNPSLCTVNADGSRSIKRDIVCTKYNPVSKLTEATESSNCVAAQRPKDSVYCLVANEVYQWKVLNTSACSTKCGSGTVQRSRECINTDIDTGARRIAPEHECEMFGLATPPTEYACTELTGCAKGWSYTSWSTCQGLCGENSMQTREASCLDNAGNRIANSECESVSGPAITSKACTPVCATWVYGEWSQCSASCNQSGTKTREVDCKDASGNVVADEFCPGLRDLLQTTESCSTSCSGSTCADLLSQYPSLPNGSYTLTGPTGNFSATCDMTGGGWTLAPNLAFLNNFSAISAIKGLNEEQNNRFLKLYTGGFQDYINKTVSAVSGNQNAASFTKTFDYDITDYVNYLQANNVGLSVNFTLGVNAYDGDSDQGNIIMTHYSSTGAVVSTWASGKADYPQAFKWYYKTLTDPSVTKIRLQHQCWRSGGTVCSSVGDFKIFYNKDLPTTNLYIK